MILVVFSKVKFLHGLKNQYIYIPIKIYVQTKKKKNLCFVFYYILTWNDYRGLQGTGLGPYPVKWSWIFKCTRPSELWQFFFNDPGQVRLFILFWPKNLNKADKISATFDAYDFHENKYKCASRASTSYTTSIQKYTHTP